MNNRDEVKSLVEDSHGLKQGEQENSWTIILNTISYFQIT